jgi:hypothetical protein
MKERKYEPGRYLRTPMQVVRAYESGQWLYLRDRVTHPAWVHNMTLGTVMKFLRRRMIRTATAGTRR